MDNLDLFSEVDTPITPVDVTSTKVEDTPPPAPKSRKSRDADKPADLPNILLFATQHQRSMWTAFKHRRDCMMQVTKFASHRDYGAKPMDQITSLDIINYRDYLVEHGRCKLDKPLSNSTINRHLSAVSACFRFAVETLRIMENRPASHLLKQKKPNTRAFTPEIIEQLKAHFVSNGHQWMADMVTLACKTGMRQGEIVSVHLSCVVYHPDTNELWLPPEVTKTNEGRMIPLAAEGAYEAYQRLVECIGKEFTHRRFYDRWNDAKDALGYTVGGRGHEHEWFKFHACRHTAATLMAKNDINQQKVKEILGHKSDATTAKYYHGDAKSRADAVACL